MVVAFSSYGQLWENLFTRISLYIIIIVPYINDSLLLYIRYTHIYVQCINVYTYIYTSHTNLYLVSDSIKSLSTYLHWALISIKYKWTFGLQQFKQHFIASYIAFNYSIQILKNQYTDFNKLCKLNIRLF